MGSEQAEGMKKEVTGLKEKCPAFKDKCPFDTPAAQKLKEHAKECPAFKEKCVFDNAITIQDMYEKLSKMPDVTQGSTHQKALVEVLKLIHSISSELKGTIGECPAFSTKKGCVFKTLCVDGEPLMNKLDNFNTEALITKSVIEVIQSFYYLFIVLCMLASNSANSLSILVIEGPQRIKDVFEWRMFLMVEVLKFYEKVFWNEM